MTRTTRRLLGWGARGLVCLLALFAVVAAAGFGYQMIASAQDELAYPPPGRLVDVGGHRLHLQCSGDGSPTVVAESGFGGTSLDWSLVQPAVAQTTHMCAYDRAGFGWSDPGAAPRTSKRIVEELHTLLGRAGVTGPYVLVGHSVGGLHAQLFASMFPGEVDGLVLLDPTPAEYLTSLEPSARRAAAPPMEQLRAIQLMQNVGLTRVFGLTVPMPVWHLPPLVQRQMTAVGFKTTVGDALLEEGSANDVNLAQAIAAAHLRADIPLTVIVRGLVIGPPDQDAAGKTADADLVRRSTRGQLIVAEGSGHYIQLDRPDLVINAINDVVRLVRTEGIQQ